MKVRTVKHRAALRVSAQDYSGLQAAVETGARFQHSVGPMGEASDATQPFSVSSNNMKQSLTAVDKK